LFKLKLSILDAGFNTLNSSAALVKVTHEDHGNTEKSILRVKYKLHADIILNNLLKVNAALYFIF
jgi:hypothetical protein